MSRGYRHFVPRAKENTEFPFSYSLNGIDLSEHESAETWLEKNKPDIEISSLVTSTPSRDLENLKREIKEELIKRFNFFKYLDSNSSDYLVGYTGSAPNPKSPEFTVLVDRYVMVTEEGKKTPKRKTKDRWLLKATDFRSNYTFNLVTSVDQLSKALDGAKDIGFDTETTGLNPEFDKIVGVSFAMDPFTGYYVPISHDNKFKEFNLGNVALDIIYEALVKASRVFMFNARFDMRVLEYTDKKYDMLKVNVIDTQLTASYADPDSKILDLKSLEKHFLGLYRIDLKDTLKLYNLDSFDFSLLDPRDAVFYAGQDGISTYLLGVETYRYYKEFGMAAEIDKMFVPRIMRMENFELNVDQEFLETELNEHILPRLDEINKELYKHIGDVNLNSNKQKEALFRSFGLDTGVKTQGGSMSTKNDAVIEMIERYDEQGKAYPEWLKLLGERAMLEKLNGSFFGKLLPQVKESNGRIRINYRIGTTATGRLSSGEDTGE